MHVHNNITVVTFFSHSVLCIDWLNIFFVFFNLASLKAVLSPVVALVNKDVPLFPYKLSNKPSLSAEALRFAYITFLSTISFSIG